MGFALRECQPVIPSLNRQWEGVYYDSTLLVPLLIVSYGPSMLQNTLSSTNPSSNNDSGVRLGFGAKASVPVTKTAPVLYNKGMIFFYINHFR